MDRVMSLCNFLYDYHPLMLFFAVVWLLGSVLIGGYEVQICFDAKYAGEGVKAAETDSSFHFPNPIYVLYYAFCLALPFIFAYITTEVAYRYSPEIVDLFSDGDRVLFSRDSKPVYVQLNDVAGVERVVEAYNQAVARQISQEQSELGKKFLQDLLVSSIDYEEPEGNVELYNARCAKGGLCAFYVNKQGYISAARIWLNNIPENRRRFILQAMVKSMIAVDIDKQVLDAAIKKNVSNENAYIYSEKANRNFWLTWENKSVSVLIRAVLPS